MNVRPAARGAPSHYRFAQMRDLGHRFRAREDRKKV
jgi:hypothetical protein